MGSVVVGNVFRNCSVVDICDVSYVFKLKCEVVILCVEFFFGEGEG